MDAAATTAAAGFALRHGEGCVAGTRILVQEPIQHEFRERLVAAMG